MLKKITSPHIAVLFLLITLCFLGHSWAEAPSLKVGSPELEQVHRKKKHALSVPVNVIGQKIGLNVRSNVAPNLEYTLTGFFSSEYESKIGNTELDVYFGYRRYTSFKHFSLFRQYDVGLLNTYQSTASSDTYLLGAAVRGAVGVEYHLVESVSMEGFAGYNLQLKLNLSDNASPSWKIAPFVQISANYYW